MQQTGALPTELTRWWWIMMENDDQIIDLAGQNIKGGGGVTTNGLATHPEVTRLSSVPPQLPCLQTLSPLHPWYRSFRGEKARERGWLGREKDTKSSL